MSKRSKTRAAQHYTASAATRAAQAPPSPLPPPPAKRFVLTRSVVFVIAAALHFWFLHAAAGVPHIFPDELHYCVTGENIRWGNGYLLRGVFSGTVPPLQPLFVAFGHSLGGDPRNVFFVLSVLMICASVFPAHAIALEAGLSAAQAALFALVAGFNPHTVYAATYMSETLQYPLFLWMALAASRWLTRPDTRSTLLLGTLLGVMAMVRYATGVVFIALLLAFLLSRLLAPDRKRLLLYMAHLGAVVAIYSAFQLGWWAYKWAHGVSALGMYHSAWKTLPYLSVPLVAAYLGDALLAAGPLTAIGLLGGIACLWRACPGLGIFTAVTTGTLVLTTAIYDGGLTGEIRERYYMYILPLLTLAAALGISRAVKRRGRIVVCLGSVVAGMVCLAAVLQFGVLPIPLLGQPWAHLLGGFRLYTWTGISSGLPLAICAGAMVLASSVMLLAPKLPPSALALGLAALLNAGSFYAVSLTLGVRAAEARDRIAPQLTLLPSRLSAGTKLVIAGAPDGFGYTGEHPQRLGSLNRAAWLYVDDLLRFEILKRVDVRIVETTDALAAPELYGALFMSATPFPRLPLVNRRWGWYLYTLKYNRGAGYVPAGSDIRFEAKQFATAIAVRDRSGIIRGSGSGREGFLVYGPYAPLPASGWYRAFFRLHAENPSLFTIEVNSTHHGGTRLAATKFAGMSESPLDFQANGGEPLEFRVIGPDRPDFRFEGVVVRRDTGERDALTPEYEITISPQAFLTEVGKRVPDGAIAGSGKPAVGFLVFGPFISLPAGAYEGKLLFRMAEPLALHADLNSAGVQLWSADVSHTPPVFQFHSDGRAPLEFRLHGPSAAGFRFEGVKLRQLQHGP